MKTEILVVKTPFVLAAIWLILNYEPDGQLLGFTIYGIPYGAIIVAVVLAKDATDVVKYLKAH